MSDEQVAEFSGVAAGTNNPVVWLHSNVYDGGKLLATYDTNGLHLHFADWLGTNRVQMNANGTMEETCISMPFGDSMQGCGPATDSTEHHFTGKEHDFESGAGLLRGEVLWFEYGPMDEPGLGGQSGADTLREDG